MDALGIRCEVTCRLEFMLSLCNPKSVGSRKSLFTRYAVVSHLGPLADAVTKLHFHVSSYSGRRVNVFAV